MQLQLHQGRLPLQPVRLQELQLLSRERTPSRGPGGALFGNDCLDDDDLKVYARSVRLIIAKLVLLMAVLIMPLGMTPAGASAHDSRAMADMPIQHCPEQSRHEHHDGIAACSMACASALPAQELVRAEPVCADHQLVRPIMAQILQGLHPEVPAPPPKMS